MRGSTGRHPVSGVRTRSAAKSAQCDCVYGPVEVRALAGGDLDEQIRRVRQPSGGGRAPPGRCRYSHHHRRTAEFGNPRGRCRPSSSSARGLLGGGITGVEFGDVERSGGGAGTGQRGQRCCASARLSRSRWAGRRRRGVLDGVILGSRDADRDCQVGVLTEAIGAIGNGSRMPPSASSRPSRTCGR